MARCIGLVTPFKPLLRLIEYPVPFVQFAVNVAVPDTAEAVVGMLPKLSGDAEIVQVLASFVPTVNGVEV